MEEAGVLENRTLLSLVLPDFEPGPKIVKLCAQRELGALSTPTRAGRPGWKIWSGVRMRAPARWQPQPITGAGSTAPETMLCIVWKTRSACPGVTWLCTMPKSRLIIGQKFSISLKIKHF
jgi:hypothetical protein